MAVNAKEYPRRINREREREREREIYAGKGNSFTVILRWEPVI